MKRLVGVIALALMLIVPVAAQNTVGKWNVGIHADVNSWLNDLNRRVAGFGGALTFGYNPSRVLCTSIELEVARLKSGQSPLSAEMPYDYLALKTTSLSFICKLKFLPGKIMSPYLLGGVGVMQYTRLNGLNVYVPNAGKRSSLRIPLGIGVERFVQRGVSVDLQVGYTFFDDKPDLVAQGSVDGAICGKLGVNFYFGSSDDEDDDDDGLTNGAEAEIGTNPTNPDTDEDGLSDGAEVKRYKTDPLNADTDGDKLKDGDEVFKYGTDPLNPDSDGDGVSDYDEIMAGTNPRDPQSHPR